MSVSVLSYLVRVCIGGEVGDRQYGVSLCVDVRVSVDGERNEVVEDLRRNDAVSETGDAATLLDTLEETRSRLSSG